MKIIPFLVGILVAIGMFRGSGAMELLTAALRPAGGRHRLPGGARAAGDSALADRQRLARVHDRSDQDPRTRLAHRAHGGDDVRHRRRRRSTCWPCTSARWASAGRGMPCRPRSSAMSSPRLRRWRCAPGCSDSSTCVAFEPAPEVGTGFRIRLRGPCLVYLARSTRANARRRRSHRVRAIRA